MQFFLIYKSDEIWKSQSLLNIFDIYDNMQWCRSQSMHIQTSGWSTALKSNLLEILHFWHGSGVANEICSQKSSKSQVVKGRLSWPLVIVSHEMTVSTRCKKQPSNHNYKFLLNEMSKSSTMHYGTISQMHIWITLALQVNMTQLIIKQL